MSVWETLEIEPTDDLKAIKKAYAKALKTYHPEEDPVGYQRLREAYDSAIKLAKEGIFVVSPSQEYETSLNRVEDYDPHELDLPIEEHPVDQFIQKVQDLYDDFFARIDIKNWESLLQEDIIWNVQYSEPLQDRLIEFLEDCPFLPVAIWQLLDQTFYWQENKEELESRYGRITKQFLLENINGIKQLGYDYFNKDFKFDYEEYLQLRADAQVFLMEDDLVSAEEALDQAFQLFQSDPDLLHLQGIYYLRVHDYAKAQQAFANKLSISPTDPDALLYQAQLHFSAEKFTETIQDCELLLEHHPEHLGGLLLMIKSYLGLHDENTAYEWITKAIELHPERPEFRPYQSMVLNKKTRKVPMPKLDFKIKSKFFLNNVLAYIFIILRRAWVYLFAFLVLLCTPLPFKYTALLLIPILWEIAKILKGEFLPLFMLSRKKRRELYFRCLSAGCVDSNFLERYFIAYDFTYIRDRLIGKRFLTKVLKQWEITNPSELKQKINDLLDGEIQQEFNHVLHQLMPLSEKARDLYIDSLSKDDPDYPKLFLANRGIHTLTENGVVAVDWAWAIYLSRFGRRLGYLSKDEAKRFMVKAAQCSQESYPSWIEYFTAFHLGNYFKAKDSKHNHYAKHGLSAIFGLLGGPQSPLLKIKWKNDLVHDQR
ncbi:DUF1266 domain-containing protein [Lederbergia galactosidilytica]|uniref:J domain-containing protein n=1 Tax=Lederbergia galactosidilytica TaxID=217031 RepID=A0A178A087_9BACI|nr:DUF1266 domain-containing protein [Lederbergia galactosidilytica]KRG13154.1 hypothetical protein ACA30_16240 [Virgibacillus soli]MBP1916468.1 tetratricopeptide (TPR) repeat protein [Lederbergia galactosidilytica]OAK73531.1 hypothetical protein ABB05_06785 [Lederbergia galactosidilytica]